MDIFHHMPDGACCSCGHKFNAGGGEHVEAPSPGDYAICLRCAAVNIYADDLTPMLTSWQPPWTPMCRTFDRAKNGEFDATDEEANVWAASPEGIESIAAALISSVATLGDKPIEPQYQSVMRNMAKMIDMMLNGEEKPKKNGFILMAFPFEGHDGRCNYISNGKREDILVLLKEQIKRFEGQPEVTGRG